VSYFLRWCDSVNSTIQSSRGIITYVIILAGNISSGPAELTNTINWARDNNPDLNLDKSMEMVFVRPRSKGSQSEPPSVISGLRRVESIKMLGVAISRKFSISQYVDSLLAMCSQSLFALRTLRQHFLPSDALHQVFQAIVINWLSYASSAWWGFTSADNRNRLKAFVRRSVKLGHRANSSATFASICDDADNKLFSHITGNSQHLLGLHPLLPPEREQHYIVFVTEVTTFNFLIVHQTPMTKTLLCKWQFVLD